jgi:hypothetical protein
MPRTRDRLEMVRLADAGFSDEAGFALTLPTTYSCSPVGQRLAVAYEAPEGRQVNVIGAYVTHGVQRGEFWFESVAKLPERGTKRKTILERAEEHGLEAEAVGRIDSERFLAFLWKLAGRPETAGSDWQREGPLVVVVDNYSVHKSASVQAARAAQSAAGIRFFYLPSYSPELSAMEPIWHTIKYHEMTKRSYRRLGAFKGAVEEALHRKAEALRANRSETVQSLRRSA